MIKELQELIPEFAGSASHTHCFLHIVNLIAKSLICQFNAKKTGKGDHELADLQKKLKEEEATCQDRVPVDESDDKRRAGEIDMAGKVGISKGEIIRYLHTFEANPWHSSARLPSRSSTQ